ncbi:TonB-dependent receptor family protein [Prosthecobacter vanneervenii]|uniref:Iron complex outermembrane receptor protein n=1 Tax=Prosthecobacter vanneervenii TaxID=48466 RepID=A0A7W8DLX6_9BACT|nr:TonB-dependent receptor [Prosthecobacter vanneervenii]MBB5034637.1 iron complex outermembrane receptor protein [Prosthecobacter vanneervenii]
MKPLSFLFLLALPGAALSQSAKPTQPAKPTTTDLKEVVITAKKDSPSLTVPSLELRREQIAQSVPGGAGVVDAEFYKRGRASTLKDALDFAPGVLVQSRFGAEESRLAIRGSGIQRTFHGRGIWTMQDGMPLNLADGGFDMQALEPLAANYIEVFRGANALQYGSSTLGGAINFISNTGYTAPASQARVEVGSFNTYRGQISSGFVSGNTDMYVSITASHTDGFRDWSKQESFRVFANIGTKISPNLENRLYITYVDSNSQLPGNLTKAQMLANPQQAAPGSFKPTVAGGAGYQERNYRLFRLADKLTYSDGGDNTITLSTFWSWKDLNHPIFQVIDQLSNDLGFDLRYDHRGSLFGKENTLTMGTGFMYGDTSDNRFFNIGGARGAQVGSYRLQATNFNFYFQDKQKLTDKLSFLAGAQVAYASRDFKERQLFGGVNPPGQFTGLPNLINNSDRLEYWGFSPKLGLLYEVDPKTQIYFNASRSFEPPSFGEATPAGNGILPLKAQTGTTLEIGTRGQRDRVSWDFSYYYAWLERELLGLGSPILTPTTTVNAGKTIHQGIEFGLNVDVLRNLAYSSDRLVLNQNFLWSDFRFSKSAAYGDRLLPGYSPVYYRAQLLYEHPCGFYAGPTLEWSPFKYAADLARTTFADPYALLGMKLGYRTKKGPSFYFEARNLTNEIYSPTVNVVTNATTPGSTAVFLPGDGRSFYGGVEWKW